MSDISSMTGPELYSLGQEHLRNAYQQWEDAPQRSDYNGRNGEWAEDFAACTQSITASSAIAAAAFAGAHAAAFGQLAADAASDVGDHDLSAKWAKAVGFNPKSDA